MTLGKLVSGALVGAAIFLVGCTDPNLLNNKYNKAEARVQAGEYTCEKKKMNRFIFAIKDERTYVAFGAPEGKVPSKLFYRNMTVGEAIDAMQDCKEAFESKLDLKDHLWLKDLREYDY